MPNLSDIEIMKVVSRCQNTNAVFGFNDILDIRKEKRAKNLYSCRLMNDSCVILIANSLHECMSILELNLHSEITWHKVSDVAKRLNINFKYKQAYVGTSSKGTLYLVNIEDQIAPTGQNADEYIKHFL